MCMFKQQRGKQQSKPMMCHADVTDSNGQAVDERVAWKRAVRLAALSLAEGHFNQLFSMVWITWPHDFAHDPAPITMYPLPWDQFCATIDTSSKLKTSRFVGVACLVSTLRSYTVSPCAKIAKVCVLRRLHCHLPHHSASTRGWKELLIVRNCRQWLRTVDVQMS